jgi:septal ring factor EnvC (AmiA/AmiB activator)
MLKKIITGTIVLLAITVRLPAEASESTGTFAPGVAAGKAPVRQKGLKKRSAARQQSGTVHQKRDRHLAKVVKRVIRRRNLPGRPAAAGLPTGNETADGRLSEAADGHLSTDFEKHKGQLARPLAGTVSMSFGPHEYMGKLHHNNVGITVDAAEGTVVKSVYQGVVTAIEEIGDVWCVIMRHGKYYSAYSNLAGITVMKGQHVSVGEELGRVGDTGQLEFLLMNENGEYVDPEKWLKK